MFIELKSKIQTNLKRMIESHENLFYVGIDREEIWNRYLAGFSDDFKPEYTCNSCKSFLRQWGGIVSIGTGNKVSTIWDNIASDSPEYGQAVANIRDYILSLPVTDIFFERTAQLGTDKNFSDKHRVIWQHFYLELPRQFVKHNPEALQGIARDSKNTLLRALTELTVEATETVLELIAQNSLYRGVESKGLLDEFLKLQKEFAKVPQNLKNNFCWIHSLKSTAVARIRNSAIGTLLINLSEGMELDLALDKYDRVVAPTNYKRPSAPVTPKMVEAAKLKLAELELLSSLDRRYATELDIDVNNVLFVDRPAKLSDVFDTISKEAKINPKTLSKLEEISINDFLTKVVPTAKTIEVLLENRHLTNFVSLLTSEHRDAKSLFKWDNNFSWSYTGGIADSMKERVKEAGGKIDGDFRFSIQWNDKGDNNIDFDAHLIQPDRQEIAFNTFRYPNKSSMGGNLDVDIMQPSGKIAVENIVLPKKSKMKHGTYKLFVHNFSTQTSNGGFSAEIEIEGELHSFAYPKNLHGKEKVYVADVVYSEKGFEIKSLLDSKNSVVSSQKWGLGTHQFHKVTKLLLSPNYWGANTGNKHFMFMLENCISDEVPKPFLNEFLKQEFNEHRKVFEILNSKLRVPESKEQLSGIGFSETKHESVIVRVTGAFKRMLKINF
jgi:hypothetical protein